jgi:hypothetical protein
MLYRFSEAGVRVSCLLSLAYLVAQCGIWLWWCDGSSRRIFTRAAVTGAWLVFTFLTANYMPELGFGHDMTGRVRTFINWQQLPYDIPALIFHYMLVGAFVVALYTFMNYSFRVMKRTLFRQAA